MTEILEREVVAQFVLSWRARGHFLPYDDYSVIDKWLAIGTGADALIRTLSEVLPKLYVIDGKSKNPPPLRLIERLVANRIAKDRTLSE